MLEALQKYLVDWFGKSHETLAPLGHPDGLQVQPAPGNLREAMTDVARITKSVGTDLERHQETISSFSDELRSMAKTDPELVAAVACRIMAANEALQGRLGQAEQTLKANAEQLTEAKATARTDGLTGLMNRQALDFELNRCKGELVRHGKRSALLLLDIDHFKELNDSYGQAGGDEALQCVAQSLQSQIRDTDFAARLGGDRFVVVFTTATGTEVKDRAEALRASLGGKSRKLCGQEAKISASAGLVELALAHSQTEWLGHAEEALRAAKQHGRDCSFLYTASGARRIRNTCEARLTKDDSNDNKSRLALLALIAPETFETKSFVPDIGREIAMWKRGGQVFTVVLAALSSTGKAANTRALEDLVEAAQSICDRSDRLTKWRDSGIAVLLPKSGRECGLLFARRLWEALVKNGRDGVQLAIGVADGQEGNTAERVLEARSERAKWNFK